MIPTESPELLWLLILTFVIAFFLAFGVGANDVANSFGTSVGSGVLSLKQACFLATIFEILGAVLIGYQVSDTVRTGVFDVSDYHGEEKLLMLGYLAALLGGAIWNLLATFLKMPISGTHSIIGAVLGFHIACKGFVGIKLWNLAQIVSSWFVSPLASGLVSVGIFIIIHKFIIDREKSLQRGLISLPFFYGFTVFVNAISIVAKGPKELMLDNLPIWVSFVIAATVGLSVGLLVYIFVVPQQKAKILDVVLPRANELELKKANEAELSSVHVLRSSEPIETLSINPVVMNTINNNTTSSPSVIKNLPNEVINNNGTTDCCQQQQQKQPINLLPSSGKSSIAAGDSNQTKQQKAASKRVDSEDDKPEIAYLFKFLQILTACFGSFAHGGNDVSNAIGPLIGVFLIWRDGNVFQTENSPFWLMLFGGLGISVGLWVWGRKVIKTIGSDLTKIVPSTGFTIEIGAATTVLLASKIGLPISTTHCKVGSVIMVGHYYGSKNAVNWSLFKNVILAWVLTVPITALLSGLAMLVLKALFI